MKKDYISPDILTYLVDAVGSVIGNGSITVQGGNYDHNSEDNIDDENDIY